MTDARGLFEAFGFEKLENGLWRFARDFSDHPESTGGYDGRAVVIVEERSGAFIGHVPFVAHSDMDLAEVPPQSLFFSSSDPRDMVALAQNEAANAYCRATGLFPDDGFSDDDDNMFITFPFMSDPWSDYAVSSRAKKDDAHVELVSPAEAYRGYVSWRDEFCEKVLAAGPSAITP
jgi:hypothetical protein